MADSILAVDDDRQLTKFLDRFLTKQGFDISTAGSGVQMGMAMEHRDFDLMILDVGLPDLDGFDIARELRKSSSMPIIFLTARDEIYDKIIGLEIGADDYLTKPFEPRELLARIRTVLRRRHMVADKTTEEETEHYSFAGLTLDIPRRTLFDQFIRPIPLTAMEFAILRCLVESSGQVVSRDRLMRELYGHSVTATNRAIDAHVARLRRKLGEAGLDRDLIRTVHGTGHVLTAVANACANGPTPAGADLLSA